jgi:hypothetical protein
MVFGGSGAAANCDAKLVEFSLKGNPYYKRGVSLFNLGSHRGDAETAKKRGEFSIC